MSKSIYKSFDELNLQKLLSHTHKAENNCLIWGPVNSTRYGTITINKKNYSAHRIIATLVYGLPAENQVVMHSCNNKPCINPEHLSIGSQSDNLKYAASLRRNFVPGLKGEEHRMSKLNDTSVREIREKYKNGISSVKLGLEYGVNGRTIRSLLAGKTWKHVND